MREKKGERGAADIAHTDVGDGGEGGGRLRRTHRPFMIIIKIITII